MWGIVFILIAGVFVAASNLCMRKSIDAGGSVKAFLVIQTFLIFAIAILLNPIRTHHYYWSPSMAVFGIAGGIVLAWMLIALGRALETGPPGLTFAALNSSTVMPSVLMVLVFGSSFNYFYTAWNGLGSVLVVFGLFWAGWETRGGLRKEKWLTFVTTAFFLHVLFLIFLSWRALFINFPDATGLFLSFDLEDAKSQWFMPMIFLTSFFIQLLRYFLSEKRAPHKKEVLYGCLGGVANGVGTFFMIRATEISQAVEHAMIYPIFAITIIILCNIWGQLLYKEKVNWLTNGLCVLGVMVGTLDWKVLFN